MDVTANFRLKVRIEPSYDVPGLFEYEAYFTTLEDVNLFAALLEGSLRDGEHLDIEMEEL